MTDISTMEEIGDLSDVMHEAIGEAGEELTNDFDDLEKSSFQGKYHKQSYRKAWETLPDFKGWLRGVDGEPNRAFCSYCQVTLFAHRLSLLKHTCTMKHQRATQKALLRNNDLVPKDPDVTVESVSPSRGSGLHHISAENITLNPSSSQSGMHHIPAEKIKVNLSSSQPSLHHISGETIKLNSTSSKSGLHHIAAEPIKLNLRSRKAQQNITSNMTVTIIQDGNAEPIELQLGQNYENVSMITDDDDLGLNTVPIIKGEKDQITENDENLPVVKTLEGAAIGFGSLKLGETEKYDIMKSAERVGIIQRHLAPCSAKQTMAHSSNFPLSTHVLDTSKGQPVGHLPVSLYRLMEGRWILVNESVTNKDGRCSSLIERKEFLAGRYKLHFDTDRYFELERKETLYPFVEIAFDVHAPLEHYHIPLLLSAFGYSTYRGS